MRVGIFTDTYFPQTSGVATSIETLKNELLKHGHEVFIFTTTDPNAVEEPDVFRYESVPFVFFKERRVALTTLNPIYNKVVELDLDIIHTQTEFGLGVYGIMSARKKGIPVVHSYHTWYENYLHYILNGLLLKKSAVKMYSRFFCQHVDAVISPSALIKDVLEDYGVKEPIHVVPTGVKIPLQESSERLRDLRSKWYLSTEDFVLISINRIAKEKNLAHVIQQLPRVIEQIPQVKLVLVGDGPEREDLEALVHNEGLSQYVIFTGMINHSEVNAYYQMADLYINLSVTETQGITFIEALANGLPLVAIKNRYLEELQQKDDIGQLIKNSSEMPSAVYQLYQNHTQLKNKDHTKLFHEISEETFYDRIISIYSQLIKGSYEAQPDYTWEDK